MVSCRISGEVHQTVPQSLTEGIHANACVVEGEEVLNLRMEEQGSQQLFASTGEDECREMHENSKEVSNKKCGQENISSRPEKSKLGR